MKIFKTLSFILLFVLLTSSVYAQRSSGWAFLFTWDRFNAGEFGLAEFYDSDGDLNSLAGVGMEYKMSSQWALQFGFGFGTMSSESGNNEDSQTLYALTAGPVFYFRGYDAEGVRPYLGARLNIGGFSATDESTAGTTKVTDEYSASSFGVVILGGADVEIIDGLRVGAGYGLQYTSFPESELKHTEVTGGVTETVTVNGPSASGFSTVFHMNLKILF